MLHRIVYIIRNNFYIGAISTVENDKATYYKQINRSNHG